jgi:hypothetical protein
MNRALGRPALLAAGLLVVVAGSGWFLLSGAGPEKKPSPPTGAVTGANDPAAPSGDQAPAAAEAPKPLSKPKTEEAAKAADATPPAPDPRVAAGAKAADERRLLLETLGSLTAAHCFQTYLNIGLLSDGKARGTYSDRDAYKVLDSVLVLHDSAGQKLDALSKLDLDNEDRETLEQMRMLSSLLHKQGKQLQAYWDSGKDEDASKYESIRKDSWVVLSKLLGLGK